MAAWHFLQSLDGMSFVLFFWYTTLFEIPRYIISGVASTVATLWSHRAHSLPAGATVSIVLVGHNEARALRPCVEALAEQTIADTPGTMQVIVVDDGSTDRMINVARDLQREGQVDAVLRLQQRGGKSAGVNLALSACTGEFIVIADIDTTFDRDAFAELLSYFSDPRVGAVSGNLGIRNTFSGLITRHQAIEYAIGISLGRRIADALGILSIVSGAFGAFRRAAVERVGGQDVEVGEDADLTMKLRRAGWEIRFAPEAHALTNAPETVAALIAQRLRWDRGLVTIWLRKFRGAFDPRQAAFRIIDVAAVADVLVFQVALAVTFPIYLAWLFYYFGEFAITIIVATLIVYSVLDLFAFANATALGLQTPIRLLPYLPLYTIFQVSVMRSVRLIAFAQEFIFRSSYRDAYVPPHIMRQVERV